MGTVVFIDTRPPIPYDASTLDEEATGGAIGTIIRVGEGLAAHHDVYVLQRHPPRAPRGRAAYTSVNRIQDLPVPDAVVVVRADLFRGETGVPALRRRFPRSRMFYWSHVTLPQCWATPLGRLHGRLMRGRFEALAGLFSTHGVTALGTSRFHAESIRKTLGPSVPVAWIYNPVDEVAPPGPETAHDPDQLIYLSSPERCLGTAVALLAEARKVRPSFRLLIASPGYRSRRRREVEGVVNLGPLPRRELFRHVRQSLCVFYPNLHCMECFGLVFAESNALGTPVLTHPIGAAPEVVADPTQLVDCRDTRAVVARLVAWAEGDRPAVSARPEFMPSTVVRRWLELLD